MRVKRTEKIVVCAVDTTSMDKNSANGCLSWKWRNSFWCLEDEYKILEQNWSLIMNLQRLGISCGYCIYVRIDNSLSIITGDTVSKWSTYSGLICVFVDPIFDCEFILSVFFFFFDLQMYMSVHW